MPGLEPESTAINVRTRAVVEQITGTMADKRNWKIEYLGSGAVSAESIIIAFCGALLKAWTVKIYAEAVLELNLFQHFTITSIPASRRDHFYPLSKYMAATGSPGFTL